MGTEMTREEEGVVPGDTGTTSPPTGTTGRCAQPAVPPAPLPAPYRCALPTLGITRETTTAPPVLPIESYRYYRQRGHRFLSSAPTLR